MHTHTHKSHDQTKWMYGMVRCVEKKMPWIENEYKKNYMKYTFKLVTIKKKTPNAQEKKSIDPFVECRPPRSVTKGLRSIILCSLIYQWVECIDLLNVWWPNQHRLLLLAKMKRFLSIFKHIKSKEAIDLFQINKFCKKQCLIWWAQYQIEKNQSINLR